VSQFPEGTTDFGTCANDGEDVYPHHPDDLDVNWFLKENFLTVLDIAKKIKSAGNTAYKEKDFPKALIKYRKAHR
jgi:hypothetical protein